MIPRSVPSVSRERTYTVSWSEMAVKTPSCSKKAATLLRNSNWNSLKAVLLAGTTQMFSPKLAAMAISPAISAGRASAHCERPAERITVSSRSPERRW